GGGRQKDRRGRIDRTPDRGAGARGGRAGTQAAKGEGRQRRQDQGRRYHRAGEARQRRARSFGQHSSPRSRRLRPDQLSQPRPARRGDETAGEGELISFNQPRRFALTARASGVRGAIAAAGAVCLRMSRAAVASWSMTATSLPTEKLRSAISAIGLREKCSRGNPLSSTLEAGAPS